MSKEKAILTQPIMLVKSIVSCLNKWIEESSLTGSDSVFNLKTAPTISIADYVMRIVKYMNASLSVYIYSLVLLDRVQEYNPGFIIHRRNIHRLLLVSCLTSAKYLDDIYFKNSFYATVGGVSLKVLNELQMEFLQLVNFNCHCQVETFEAYRQRLELFGEINLREQQVKQNVVTQKKNIKATCSKGLKRENIRRDQDESVTLQIKEVIGNSM